MVETQTIDDVIKEEIEGVERHAERDKRFAIYIGQVVKENSEQLKQVNKDMKDAWPLYLFISAKCEIKQLIPVYLGDTDIHYFSKGEEQKSDAVTLGWAELTQVKTSFWKRLFDSGTYMQLVLTEKGKKIVEGYCSALGMDLDNTALLRHYISPFGDRWLK